MLMVVEAIKGDSVQFVNPGSLRPLSLSDGPTVIVLHPRDDQVTDGMILEMSD